MAEDDEQLWKRECLEYDTHFKLRNVMTGKVLTATEFDKIEMEGMCKFLLRFKKLSVLPCKKHEAYLP